LSIASIVLLLALFDGWQYGFFIILRFVVFSSTAYVAYLAYQDQNEGWAWFMGAIAILFNPFIPVYLTRDVWIVIDFVTFITLLFTSYSLSLDDKEININK
jgi:hypothetical protein